MTPAAAPGLRARLRRRLRDWLLQRRFWLRPESRDELRAQLRELHAGGLLDERLLQMLEGAFNISRLRAADIMIRRPDMNVVRLDAAREDVLAQVAASGHSRYPVIDDDRGEVEGILLAKDVLTRAAAAFSVKDLMLPAHTLPENRRLGALLADFQSERLHMGIVVNEYGEAAGLVTIEDILEEIVGEIRDEHDRETAPDRIRAVGGDEYEVAATASLEDFRRHFGAALDAGDAKTVGALVLQHCGRLPRIGDQVELGGFRFTVARVTGRRLRALTVRRPPADA